jgi:hypothetical protein
MLIGLEAEENIVGISDQRLALFIERQELTTDRQLAKTQY